jgi:hypothetical protein
MNAPLAMRDSHVLRTAKDVDDTLQAIMADHGG